MGSDRVQVFMASAKGSDLIEDAKTQIVRILHRRRHIPQGEEDNFSIRDPRELQTLLQSVTGMLTTLLAGVAAVSLVVGGIGIMNIMLVSVTERTREIGIRRAVGAKKRNIMTQFIMEAIVLCELGGIVGVVLGIVGGNATAYFLEMPPALPIDWAIIGLLICSVVGIVFGTYPAYKAANLDPIESLRYE